MEPPVDFVIITPLAEERDALLDKLENPKRTNPSDEDSRVYYVSQLTATFPDGTPITYKVVVAPLIGMGRVEAATATSDAVRKWKPRFVLLVGIAGGYGEAGVQLGDVLIANQIADYEEQKLTEAQAKIRWQVMQVNTRLLAEAQNFRGDGWLQTIASSRPEDGQPKIHFGTICTGDKVIANSLLAEYEATWNRLIGVEMEAGGTARAAFQAANTPGFLMIRGVSDLADKEKGSEQVEQWRGYGCEMAAAFTVAFLKTGPVTASNSSPSFQVRPSSLSNGAVSNLDQQSGPVVSIAHVPPAVSYFVGRDQELAQLDTSWEAPKTRVISLVAFGGVGKSALVAEWLRRLADNGWRGAQ